MDVSVTGPTTQKSPLANCPDGYALSNTQVMPNWVTEDVEEAAGMPRRVVVVVPHCILELGPEGVVVVVPAGITVVEVAGNAVVVVAGNVVVVPAGIVVVVGGGVHRVDRGTHRDENGRDVNTRVAATAAKKDIRRSFRSPPSTTGDEPRQRNRFLFSASHALRAIAA